MHYLVAVRITLYQRRKTDGRMGIKMPEVRPKRAILFEEIAADALAYSKDHKALLSATEIERLFARSGSNDGQRRDILCIRGLESKSIKKRFIPAVALMFVSLDEVDIQLGFVVNNQLSEEHANAFAGTSSFLEIINLFRRNAGERKSEMQDVQLDQFAVVQSARHPIPESVAQTYAFRFRAQQ